jgi:hypothetical protein
VRRDSGGMTEQSRNMVGYTGGVRASRPAPPRRQLSEEGRKLFMAAGGSCELYMAAGGSFVAAGGEPARS